MTTLAAGSSVTFSIPIGQVATVTAGSGIAVLAYPISSPIAITGNSVIGPFSFIRIVTLTAIATIEYTIAALPSGSGVTGLIGLASRPVVASPAVAATSIGGTNAVFAGTPTPSTAVQWLIDGAPVSGATAIPYQSQVSDGGKALALRVTATNSSGTVVATSDPVTLGGATLFALNSTWGVDGDSITNTGNVPSWVFGAITYLKARLRLIANLGVGGSVLADVINRGPTLWAFGHTIQSCAVLTNDVVTGTSVATLLTNYTKYKDDSFANNPNLQIFFCHSIGPRNDAAYSPAFAANEVRRNALNSGIQSMAAADSRVVYISNEALNPAVDTFDGLHQTWDGCFDKLGVYAGSGMSPRLASGSINDSIGTNLLTNTAKTGAVAATGTNVSGTLPTGYAALVSGTGTTAVVFSAGTMVNQDGITVPCIAMTISGTPTTIGAFIDVSFTMNTAAFAAIGAKVENWFDWELAAGSANVDVVYSSIANGANSQSSTCATIMSALARSGRIRSGIYAMPSVQNTLAVVMGVRLNNAGPVTCVLKIGSDVGRQILP